MLVLPCPLTMDAFAGTVHVYENAPATIAIEYVFVIPHKADVCPLMLPGTAGIELTTTFTVLEEELPQKFVNKQVYAPPVVAA